MSTRVDPQYICQRAANAIIAEIGPYQVSNDALQTINHFLDEFLGLLVSSSLSLDLSRVKAVVFTLLPSTLGKNAIVEAELEVKTFTETEAIDFDLYERMRQLGTEGPFPLHKVFELLREKCHEFCTLAERQLQTQLQTQRQDNTSGLVIVPIVAIYVTTILEHIGEYILAAIAMTAEHEDTDYIRIKEVFLALIDDVQVGGVFYQMDLREKLEKQAKANGLRPRIVTPSFISPSTKHSSIIGSANNSHHPQQSSIGEDFFDISFDDLEYVENSHNDHFSVSGFSGFSSQQRPMSMMSINTSNGTFLSSTIGQQNNKKAYKLFKKEEMSLSPTPIYDPDGSPITMDFEDLIRSGDTMRASLTPNRLKSIEINDPMRGDPPKASWERRSTANLSLSSSGRNGRPGTPSPLSPHQLQHQQKQLPNLTTNPPPRFENPRDQPKPTHTSSTAASPLDHKPASSTVGHVKQPQQPAIHKLANRSPPPRETSPPVPVSVAKKTTKPRPTAMAAGMQPPAAASIPFVPTLSVPASIIPTSLVPFVSTPSAVPEPEIQEPKALEPPLVSAPEPPTIITTTATTTTTITTTTNIVSDLTTSLPTPLAAPAAPTSPTLAAEMTPPTTTSKKDAPVALKPTIMRRSSSSNKLSRESLRRKREAATAELVGSYANTTEIEQEKQVTAEPASLIVTTATPRPSSPPASERSFSDEETMAAKVIITKSEEQETKATPVVAVTEAVDSDDDKNAGADPQQQQEEENESMVTPTDSMSPFKTCDTMMKDENVTRPVAQRRHAARDTEDLPPRPVSRVLDKVMLFERSLDEFAEQQQQHHHRPHRASAYITRRERFLYLQREPGVLERHVPTPAATTAVSIRRPCGVDVGIQTDHVRIGDNAGKNKIESDEEWFLQDDEWEDDHDDQDLVVVEWLLGEA